MGLATFIGGVHPFEGKELSQDRPIKLLAPEKGEEMVFPLSQHIGAPAKPLVQEGDRVLKGQIIAEPGGFISANVLSSVSGKVKKIEPRLVANGAMVNSIIVENDGEEAAIEHFGEDRDYTKLSKEEIVQIVKDAGITGLGGAVCTNETLSGGSVKRVYRGGMYSADASSCRAAKRSSDKATNQYGGLGTYRLVCQGGIPRGLDAPVVAPSACVSAAVAIAARGATAGEPAASGSAIDTLCRSSGVIESLVNLLNRGLFFVFR